MPYLDRRDEPPHPRSTDDDLLAALAVARGRDAAGLLGARRNDVLVSRHHLEPNAWNDADPEWTYTFTTALTEFALRDDVDTVRELLADGCAATRFPQLPDGSTGTWAHTYNHWRLSDRIHRTCPLPRAVEPRVPRAPDPVEPDVDFGSGVEVAGWLERQRAAQDAIPGPAVTQLLWRAARDEVQRAERGELAPDLARSAKVCALWAAIDDEAVGGVEHWIAAGADPTAGGPGPETAIGRAIRMDAPEILGVLLDARPEALQVPCAWTLPLGVHGALEPLLPLHQAALRGSSRVVRELVRRGADPAVGFPRSLPLTFACTANPPAVRPLTAPTAEALLKAYDAEAILRAMDVWPWSHPARDHLRGGGWLPGATVAQRLAWQFQWWTTE